MGSAAAVGGILGGAGALAAGAGALFGGRDKQDFPQQELLHQPPIFSPTFSLQSGVLSRRSDTITPRQNELGAFTRSLRGGLGNIRTNLAGLREQVRPGFGRLSRIAATTIRQAGAQAVGNLRTNLQRRNVLGSSFGDDAIARVRSEFAQQEEQAKATAFVQELAANLQIEGLDQQTSQLLLQQAQTEASQITQQIQRELGELGIAADFYAKIKQNETISGLRRLLLDETAAQFGLPAGPAEAESVFDKLGGPRFFGRGSGRSGRGEPGGSPGRGGGLEGRAPQSEDEM